MEVKIEELLARARSMDPLGPSATREKYIAEISFKAGMEEEAKGGTNSLSYLKGVQAGEKMGIERAIKVYAPYVKGLEEENNSLVGVAATHGWLSSQIEFGKRCRGKIKGLKGKGL